jgi:hypothetical protein
VAGVTDASFNAVGQTIIATPSTTEFTFAQTGANATSGAGTATMLPTKFVPMRRLLIRIPDVDPYDQFYYWLWQDETIKLIGSTAIEDIRLTHEKQLPVLTLTKTGNQVALVGVRDQLALATAGLVARSRGVTTLAGDMTTMATELGKVILNRDALSNWARLEPVGEPGINGGG